MKKVLILVLLFVLVVNSPAHAFDLGFSFGGTTSIISVSDDIEYRVGEKAIVDGIAATLVDISESKGDMYTKPRKGFVYLICEFKIENTTEEGVFISSMLCFNASCDNETFSISFEALSTAMMTGKIQMDRYVEAGEKANGVVGYEVPKDWKHLMIKFTPKVWGSESAIFSYIRKNENDITSKEQHNFVQDEFSPEELSALFKEKMDEYEQFFIDFAELIKEVPTADNTFGALADYAEIMEKYWKVMEGIQDIDLDDLSVEDIAYYWEVVSRLYRMLE